MSPDARPLHALAAPRVKEPMSHAPDLTMPHAGDILGGRYVLAERIGAGGMGRVFRARDEVLRRDVAVKIFFADRTDEAESLRRMAEARALAALDHPSLVTLYDARLDTGDHVYLVMELIDGPSLQRRIERGALAPADVAGIVADLAAALAVVHEAGIVHRDIKPSNVLLRPVRGTDRGVEAVLADFGVAHLVDATRLTTPGTVIGTAAYLAPEQVRGEPPQPASDVYALGLLAIEALTRLHPFGGGSVQETLLARLARQPDVPASLGYAWRSLLSAMTAHDPAARPSATAVAEQAVELAAGRETVAVDTGPVTVVDDAAWIDLGLPAAAIAAGVSTERPSEPTAALLSPATAGDATSSGSRATPDAAHASPTRRRRWAWAGVGTAAAVVLGGHLVAFSFTGSGSVPASGSVPSPTPSLVAETSAPAPSETPVDIPVESAVDTTTDVSSGQAPAAPVSVDQTPVDQTPVEVVPLEPAPVEPSASGSGPAAEPGVGPGADAGGGPASGRGNGVGNGGANGKAHGNGKGGPGAP